jgi:hypothetical protein
VILVLALSTVALAADPFVGTWKLNVAKSKSSFPPSKSTTVKIEAQDNGLKIVSDSVNAEGKPIHAETAFKYDGKDYPYTQTGVPPDVTVVAKRINANTRETTLHFGGKEVFTSHDVVSKDGKTMTRTMKGTNSQGQEYTATSVYDKQ